MGWARIISSVSIAMRFLRNMLVGYAKLSWSEMVGNGIGNASCSDTPLVTASINCGTFAWHGLKPDCREVSWDTQSLT